MGCLKRSGGQCSLHGKDTSPSKNAHCNFGRLCIWYGWKYIPTASWKSIGKPGYYRCDFRSKCCCRVWHSCVKTANWYCITSCSDIRSFGILSDLCFVSGRRIFQCEADLNWNWYAGIFKCDYFMALIKGIRV